MVRQLFLRIFLITASAAITAQASTFTIVQPSVGETDLLSLLTSVYGVDGLERIDDAADVTWGGGSMQSARALSRQSAASQRFGACWICDGSDDLLFGATIGVDGLFSVDLLVASFPFPGNAILFDDAKGNGFVGRVFSDPSLNADGADHMVSFRVRNRPSTYVIAFEDWIGVKSDRDFNDFLVEFTLDSGPDPLLTPEPSSAVLLLGGGLALLWLGRRRVNRRVGRQ